MSAGALACAEEAPVERARSDRGPPRRTHADDGGHPLCGTAGNERTREMASWAPDLVSGGAEPTCDRCRRALGLATHDVGFAEDGRPHDVVPSEWGTLKEGVYSDDPPTLLQARLMASYCLFFLPERTQILVQRMVLRINWTDWSGRVHVSELAAYLGGHSKSHVHRVKRTALAAGVLRSVETKITKGFNGPSTYSIDWTVVRATYRAYLAKAVSLPRRLALAATKAAVELGRKLWGLLQPALPYTPPTPPASPAPTPAAAPRVKIDQRLLAAVAGIIKRWERENPNLWDGFDPTSAVAAANMRAALDELRKRKAYTGTRKDRYIQAALEHLYATREPRLAATAQEAHIATVAVQYASPNTESARDEELVDVDDELVDDELVDDDELPAEEPEPEGPAGRDALRAVAAALITELERVLDRGPNAACSAALASLRQDGSIAALRRAKAALATLG